ncbi:hypothetical protein PhCBS80983_g04433 [Powellomyces hirtus]|uniref:Kinetochore protein SPC25 n=1 Tax=Powellomyces hirtus TaxID=109895 RepID=A0A507DYQ2_9FUNG|nr:hypothetical protein PhCBS80983_g04433 [Powellomyces hirtus]
MSLAPQAAPLASTPSLTEPNHQIADLSARCTSFLQNFDSWVLARRKQLVDKKAEHIKVTTDLKESQNQIKSEIEAYKGKQSDLQRAYEKERQEAEQMKSEVARLKAEKEDRGLTKEELMDRVRDKRDEIRRRREELARKQEARDHRQGKSQPELDCYIEKLAMTVNGIDQGVLEFVFTHINSTDWMEEYSFTLDIRKGRYKVTECNPPIAKLDELLEFVNTSKEFYTFLKLMRRGFTEAAKKNGK